MKLENSARTATVASVTNALNARRLSPQSMIGLLGRCDLIGYALEWYLFAAAVLPVGIPIITLGGAIPAAVGFGLVGAGMAIAQVDKMAKSLRLTSILAMSVVAYTALILYLALVVWKKDQPAPLVMPNGGEKNDNQPAQLRWQEFNPPDRSFQVLFPGLPDSNMKKTPAGGDNVLHSVKLGQAGLCFL